MTTDVWKDKQLMEIAALLGFGRVSDLTTALGKNRKTVQKLVDCEHEEEPVLLLEELARVLNKRAQDLGLTVRSCDLRAAWRLGADGGSK